MPTLLPGLIFAAQEGLNVAGMRTIASHAGTERDKRTMKVPLLRESRNKVVDSRESKGRRSDSPPARMPRNAASASTSYERASMRFPTWPSKKDGTRERFDRQKLVNGLLKACEKRPVSLKSIRAIADRVESTLQERQT